MFVDRLLAMLVHLRHAVTHDVLACWFGVDRSTITRAIGEVRPLLAERGCTISPGARLRTLAEVVDHLGTSGQTGIIDGAEIRVRRPAAGRKDRDTFISGKSKQNAAAPAFSPTARSVRAVAPGQQAILWQTVLQEREASLGVLKDAAASPGSGCGATAERPPDEQRADRAADGASAARSPCRRQADGRQGELR
ncbi:transposase family protein [Streptomyces massasporeus]|uniref:helix-turn-helix domain-containing protein n=1 Tax=Streptomyces massasporeus TaxID=67324 RepID=UPI00382E3EEE